MTLPSGVWTFTLEGVERSTDANGRIVWPNLEPGTYTLCEVDIPAGWHSSLEQVAERGRYQGRGRQSGLGLHRGHDRRRSDRDDQRR